MVVAAIPILNLATETLVSRLVTWLAIAQPVITSLLVFAVAIYIAKKASSLITKYTTHNSRFLSQATYLAVLALLTSFTAVALGLTWSTSNVLNLASTRVEVADSQDYQKNVSIGERNVALGGGGYVTGIYLHPLQKDLVYIKTDVGGFYRWNSVNNSWVPLTDHFSLAQSNYYGGEALALDRNNPNVVYIAVGTFTADWWPHKGTIFKSTDRGETWMKLNLDLKMGGNEELRWTGERLAVDPFNSKTIFFGSRLDGLWKSIDSGETWSKVLSFPGKPKASIGITAIAFNQQASGWVYAIAYGDGIYQSSDTGFSWSKMADSPSEAKRIAIASNGILYATHSSGVSKYLNGTWSDITPFGTKDSFNAISINPANPQDVLVCTSADKATKTYRSLDGGVTWTEQKRSMNNTVSWWSDYMLSTPAVSTIQFDPKQTGRVWFADWYGIWRTENINANPIVWTNYEKGHEEIVIFSLVSPPTGTLLLSGVADVDGFYHNKGLDIYPSQTFSSSGPGFQDTYSIAYCETNPSKMVRVGGRRWNNTYTGATSTNGGRTWKEFRSFPGNTMPTRVAISATNPNRFVVTVSEGQALQTDDNGISWKQVTGLPNGFKGPWNWIQPLAADTVDGDRFYYYANGKFYRSTDGGASFSIVNESLPTENQWHSLKALPGVKGEVWLSLDKNGIYRSTDGGQTFSKLDKVERAYLFAFGKPQPGSTVPALYLYGKIADIGEGIFRSLDRGKTWTRMGDRHKPVGNHPQVMEASKQKFGLVFIGTGGRGIYYGSQ